jgi:hypothetical protein
MTYNLERRQSPRKRFEHLLYVEIEPGNGGMVLNFSEHGFGFRAVKRVHPKEEVKFAFNLADQRRLEGRGRLEWADKEGRVAGLQFTDVSEEFRSEMRNWLATSPEVKSPKNLTAPPAPSSSEDPSTPDVTEPSIAARRREALLRAASAKSPVRSISSIPSPVASPNPAPPPVPEMLAEPFVPESPRIGNSGEVPWAAILPPAVGVERKPTTPIARPSVQKSEFGGAAAFQLASFDPATEPHDIEEEHPTGGETIGPVPFEPKRPGATKTAFENPIAAVEARTAGALNEHAQALLQHIQHEEQRMVGSFRESSARIIRDAERQLFPIREGVQAQIKSLESSVASAAASAKVLDQYPTLLERAQQQALDRFQSQVQEILHGHVMELRRRSDAVLQELNTRVIDTSTALMPRRIRTSSGIIITAIIVMLLALLFTFRREAAAAFIWLGQQMVEPVTASEPAKSANSSEAKPPAESKPEVTPNTESAPPPTEGAAAPREAPHSAKPETPSQGPRQVTPQPAQDVRALWAEVANGNISAELTLANMYYTGHGVTKSCYQAHRLFAAAARKGNEEGRQRLAELDHLGCT